MTDIELKRKIISELNLAVNQPLAQILPPPQPTKPFFFNKKQLDGSYSDMRGNCGRWQHDLKQIWKKKHWWSQMDKQNNMYAICSKIKYKYFQIV